MALNLYLGNTTSDLSGGFFNRYLEETVQSSSTITQSLGASATVTSYGFTRPGIPDNSDWSTGSIEINVYVTVVNSGITLAVKANRINSSGVVQESTSTTAAQTLGTAGSYTFTIASKDWATGNSTDRLRIDYIFVNTRKNTQTVTLQTGTSNTLVSVPSKSFTKTLTATNTLISSSLSKIIRQAGFYIERKTGIDGTWEEIAVDDVSPYTDTYNLVSGNAYYYRIRKFENGAFGSYSNEVSIEYISSGSSIRYYKTLTALVNSSSSIGKCTNGIVLEVDSLSNLYLKGNLIIGNEVSLDKYGNLTVKGIVTGGAFSLSDTGILTVNTYTESSI